VGRRYFILDTGMGNGGVLVFISIGILEIEWGVLVDWVERYATFRRRIGIGFFYAVRFVYSWPFFKFLQGNFYVSFLRKLLLQFYLFQTYCFKHGCNNVIETDFFI